MIEQIAVTPKYRHYYTIECLTKELTANVNPPYLVIVVNPTLTLQLKQGSVNNAIVSS